MEITDSPVINVKANGIVWDTDGDDSARLPSSATITVDRELFADDETAVADALSDRFGFAVVSIKSTKIVG